MAKRETGDGIINKSNFRYYINKILSVPIYIKITGILLLIVVALEFATIFSLYIFYYRQEHARLKKSGSAAGRIIAYRIEDYMEENNIPKLKEMIKFDVANSSIVQYMVVKKEDGSVIAYAAKKGFRIEQGKYIKRHGNAIVYGVRVISPYPKYEMVDLKSPVVNDDTSGRYGRVGAEIGTLRIGLFSDSFHHFLDMTLIFIIFVLFPLIISTIIFFRWISISVLKPLSDLSDAAESAKKGNYNIVVSTPKFADEKLAGLINGFNDMLSAFSKTEYKWENKDLRRKEFIKEVIGAQEFERKKLSRELHDEMEQFLVYISMKFKILGKIYNIERGNEHIDEMMSYIAKEFDNIKNITKELRPGVLYELGLYKALMQYAEEIKFNHNIKVEIFTAGMQEFKSDEYTEINIYRIFQEAFSNIIRHSNADAVKITINFENCIFHAVIEDNGKGFKMVKADKSKGENFGIIGMKERAEILGGTINIKTKPGSGTTIVLNIPIDKAIDKDDEEAVKT